MQSNIDMRDAEHIYTDQTDKNMQNQMHYLIEAD